MLNSGSARFPYWWISLLMGILFLVIGIIIIKKPIDSFYAMSFILGLPLVVSGGIEIVITFQNRKNLPQWSLFFMSGIVDFLIGLFLMTNPDIILFIITFLIGVLLLIRAIASVRKAIVQKEQSNKNWIYSLLLGILLLGFTIYLVINPKLLGAAIAFWIALALIIFGLVRVYHSYRLRSLS
jgi:uncharacterized membrane protein HdeD (DUF308 family)